MLEIRSPVYLGSTLTGFMLNTVKTDQTSGEKKRKCFEYFIINTYIVYIPMDNKVDLKTCH